MKYFFLIISFFTFASTQCQEVLWYAKIEKKAPANTAVQLEFVLENGNGRRFNPPKFEGVKVLSGPMNSSSTTIINGKMSSSQSIIYDIMLLKEGKVTIGPATIYVNNKTYRTRPVTVNVTKSNNIAKILDGSDMLIRMELSDSTAYIGQQVIMDYVLYFKQKIRYNGIVEHDEFKGLHIKYLPANRKRKTTVINGETYQSAVVEKIAVFPQRSGRFDIQPCKIKVGIPVAADRRRRGFLSFGQYNNVVLTADPVSLNVNELPAQKPKYFSGGVGNYSIQIGLDKRETTTDDAIVMHMTIKGDGDARLLGAPELPFDPNWEVYEPTVIEENSFDENNRLVHYKKFEYILLPNNTGQLKLNPYFTYFNVDSSSYQTMRTNPVYITVNQGNRKILSDDSKILSDRELSGMMVSTTELSSSNPFVSPWYLLSLLAMGGGFVGMFVKKSKNDGYNALSPEERKRREAEKLAKSRLVKAKQLMEDNSQRSYFEEISIAMNGYLADKYNISHAEISKDLLRQHLIANSSVESVGDRYYNLLNQCEMALFAGQNSADQMGTIYNESISLISDIEQS